MFQSIKLPRVLKGFRPLVLASLKLPQITALQTNGPEEISEQVEGGTGPKLDEPALQRLLSRTEAELSEPDAMQRRVAIARLKVAAVNSRR